MREVLFFSCSLVRVYLRFSNLVRVGEPCVGRYGRMVNDVKRQLHFAAKEH